MEKNGVNVDQLIGTIEAVKGDPEVAKFQFRSKTKWVEGGHCKTEFRNFYGAKTEDSTRTETIVVEGDEPGILLGKNRGANAVEAILHALASCLTVGFVYNAAASGIAIESLEFELEGDIDLHAFLGLSEQKRPGYDNIRVKYKVKADAPQEKLDELFEYVKKTSPVLDMLENPVKVSWEAA
ncbi:OsmC family protein [Limibacter armeniacum]|uniref:OsmC family protein n=1 Tax=Limibacter armeniacum TaxID=466084 RepID=UPI002FE66649